jgi:hypothetical protein
MARLFMVSFQFKQKQYDAEIMVDDASESNIISINLPDRKLHQIIPGGKAILKTDENIRKLPENAPPVEYLKQAILHAFKKHESMNPPISIW